MSHVCKKELREREPRTTYCAKNVNASRYFGFDSLDAEEPHRRAAILSLPPLCYRVGLATNSGFFLFAKRRIIYVFQIFWEQIMRIPSDNNLYLPATP